MKETVKKALTGDFNRKKGLMFLITALLTVLVWNLPIDCFGIEGLTVVQQRIIAIFVMAVMLWLTEAIPAWATSVVIIFVLLFGASNSAFNIMQGSEGEYGNLLEYQGIMACFADPTIILFLGGFIMAIAATKSRLDVLMAKTLIAPFGKRSENVLLGFMLITGIFLHVYIQHRHRCHDAYIPDTGIQGSSCQWQGAHSSHHGHPHRSQPGRYGNANRNTS